MNADKEKPDTLRNYRKVMALQAQMLRFLEDLQVDPDVLQAYREILRYLRTRTEEQVLVMLRRQTPKQSNRGTPAKGLWLPDEAIRNLTLEQVRDQLARRFASRQLLERIAVIRFGDAKSAVSSRISLSALQDRIASLIADEATHESIRRVASAKRE